MMGTTLSREAYEKLIAENIAWLEKQPRTLERDHIIEIVRRSPQHEYARPEDTATSAGFIWCDNCECIQPFSTDRMTGTDVTGQYTGPVDLMCGECRLVIATTYDSRLPQSNARQEKE